MGKRVEKKTAIREHEGTNASVITKFASLGNDGFSVLMPYHKSRSGFVGKILFDPMLRGGLSFGPPEDLHMFSATDRVKLSYHGDGFVHFSGEIKGKIISGLDPVTKEPKGVGLKTNPLTNPISSGPTFAVQAWGLDDFDALEEDTNALIFGPDGFYSLGAPAASYSYSLQWLVYPASAWFTMIEQDLVILLSGGVTGSVGFRAREMNVVEMQQLDVVLAGFGMRFPVCFQSPSGWVLSGPAKRPKSGMGYGLTACYPKSAMPLERSVPSIDFPPPAKFS
jgi:hypothetical protein